MGREETGVLFFFNGYRVSVWGDQKMLEMDNCYHWTTLWIYLMPPYCILQSSYSGKFYLCIFYYQKKKKSSQDSLQNTSSVLLKTINVRQSKESLRNYHNQEEPKETWQVNVKWYPGSNPGTEKDIRSKTKEIWINCGLS